MCDTNATRFFRPWSVAESSSFQSTEDTQGNIQNRISSPMKQDEDNESISSVSTYGECSTGSSSEHQVSSACVAVERIRHRSESSVEGTSSSSSVNSEDVTAPNSLDRLNNFVLASPAMSTYPMASTRPEASTLAVEASSLMANGCPGSTSVYPMDYLQRLAFHSTNTFGTLQDNSMLMTMNIGSGVPQASTVATTGQPFCYNYSGLPHLPQELYGSSVQQAVEMIHRQDAVAKQMKKLRPKKFRCEHCDVAFSNNGQLKGHIRIHTGERPFKCDAEGCGKSFTRNEELTRHKRIHTGLRPHACVICGKCFGRKDHLKKHMRTHENRDPYRMSAAALSMYGMGHALPPPHAFPPYMYPM